MNLNPAHQQQPPALPAAVRVRCPGCDAVHQRANTPGEVVVCPHCAARLRLPAVTLPAVTLPAVPIHEPPAEAGPVPWALPARPEDAIHFPAEARPAPPPPAPVTLQVSARLLVWPPVCCRCGRRTEGTREVWCGRATRQGYETRGWDVPACDGCQELPPAVEALAWNGTVWTFRFLTPAYARLFAQANAPKLLGGTRGVASL